MGGRLTFTSAERDEIRDLLRQLRLADPAKQKQIRGNLRRIGFYITDFSDSGEGFTRADFDEYVQLGTIKIQD